LLSLIPNINIWNNIVKNI